MGFTGDGIDIDVFPHGDAAEAVEVFHGEIELFFKEFLEVGQVGTAAGEEDFLRRTAAVLGAEKGGGLADLCVEAAQGIADEGAEGGGGFIELGGVSPAEGDEAGGELGVLRLGKGEVVVLRDGGGESRSPDADAAGEKAGTIDVNEVAGLRPDVEEHGAFLQVRVVIAEGIVEGGGRGIDELGAHATAGDGFADLVERVSLDGDEDDFFFNVIAWENLPIPDDFIDRERENLLGLEANQLVDILLIERRQLDEAVEHGLAGEGVAGLELADLQALGEFLDGQLDLRLAGRFCRRVRQDAGGRVFLKNKTSAFGEGENSHRDALGTDVECDDRLLLSHDIGCVC